jgi:hypothetical protein
VALGRDTQARRHIRTLFSLGAARELTDAQTLDRFAARDGEPAEIALPLGLHARIARRRRPSYLLGFQAFGWAAAAACAIA